MDKKKSVEVLEKDKIKVEASTGKFQSFKKSPDNLTSIKVLDKIKNLIPVSKIEKTQQNDMIIKSPVNIQNKFQSDRIIETKKIFERSKKSKITHIHQPVQPLELIEEINEKSENEGTHSFEKQNKKKIK